MRKILFLWIVVLFTACQSKPKSGYVEVPTVTQNALSGVYNLAPTHENIHLYYEELGTGEPVILIHGQAVDGRMWDAAFFELAKQYRTIRLDLRGYGKSDMPEVGFGFLYADDLKNFMDSLGIKKAHIAGVSLGGMVLADFVALYPDYVQTATISSGAISNFPDRSKVSANVLKIYNDTIFTLRREDVRKNLAKGLDSLKVELKKSMKYVSGKHYRKIKKQVNVMIDDWQGWQWTHPEVDAFIGVQANQLLSEQKNQPRILFIIGQYDSKASKRSMQQMATLCKKSKIKVLPDAGHYTAMECPKDFVRDMEQFIQER